MRSKMIIDEYGTKNWELPNGDLHREDRPAFEDVEGFEKQWWIRPKT
jgi:hypothetical protein